MCVFSASQSPQPLQTRRRLQVARPGREMAGGSAVLAAVLLASLTVPASPITTDVDPKNALVLPGNNITILCRVGKPIYFCRFEIPGEKNAALLTPGSTKVARGISYYGNGFDSGQCGLRLENIQSKQNGHLNCTMGVSEESEEAKGTMTLIVAQSPQLPELRVSVGRKGSYVFMEGESLRATCKIAKGRPVARMTWYLGDSPLREGLSRTLLEKDKEGLETITQNVTRTLLWSDNGKQLQCVANHYALTPGSEKSNFQINVEYAPKPIQHDAAVEEADNGKGNGRIVTLEINANPKPTIRWMAKGKVIREGTSDSDKIFDVEKTINNGTGKWITRLNVHSVDEDILNAKYQVIAENPHGKQTYDVSLTPSLLTQELQISSGIIMGAVVAVVVLIVIIIILCYAWRAKKWCCAAGSKASQSGSQAHIDPNGALGATSASLGKDGMFEGNQEKAGDGGVLGPGALGASTEYVNGGGGGVGNQEDAKPITEKPKDDKDTPV